MINTSNVHTALLLDEQDAKNLRMVLEAGLAALEEKSHVASEAFQSSIRKGGKGRQDEHLAIFSAQSKAIGNAQIAASIIGQLNTKIS